MGGAVNGDGPDREAAGPNGDPPFAPGSFLDLPSVIAARREAGTIQMTVHEPHIAIPALLERLAARGLTLSRLTTRHASLEDVFVALTGRHLRDE